MSRRRRVGAGLAAVLVACFALAFYGWYLPTRRAVEIGVGMLAKQVCSCLYVARRELDDCRADQFASMDRIQLVVVEAEQRVRAFVPAFAERSAIHRDGLGCTLQ